MTPDGLHTTIEDIPDFPYCNGVLWDKFFHRAVIMYAGSRGEHQMFGLMVFGRHMAGWPACCINFQEGQLFTRDELKDYLARHKWECKGFWYGEDYPRSVKEVLSEKDFADLGIRAATAQYSQADAATDHG